jgi:hypothetical protein
MMTGSRDHKPFAKEEGKRADGSFWFVIRWLGFAVLYFAGIALFGGLVLLIFYGHGTSEGMARFADFWVPATIKVLTFDDHLLWASVIWGFWIALVFWIWRKRSPKDGGKDPNS